MSWGAQAVSYRLAKGVHMIEMIENDAVTK